WGRGRRIFGNRGRGLRALSLFVEKEGQIGIRFRGRGKALWGRLSDRLLGDGFARSPFAGAWGCGSDLSGGMGEDFCVGFGIAHENSADRPSRTVAWGQDSA